MQPGRITLVRVQVDIPEDMAIKLDQLKRLEGVPKRHVLKRALEDIKQDMRTVHTALVRVQVDIPEDMAEMLNDLKESEGISKRYVIKKALEELFKRGKVAL